MFHMRTMNFALRHPLLYKFSKLQKEEADALRVLHGFTDGVIRKRRQELLGNNNDNDIHQENEYSQRKLAFLDILLQSSIDGKPLSDLDILEETNTFMFEVRIAEGLCWIFLFLTKSLLNRATTQPHRESHSVCTTSQNTQKCNKNVSTKYVKYLVEKLNNQRLCLC